MTNSITLYHGSSRSFDFPDFNKLGTNTGDPLAYVGLHLTPNADMAMAIFSNKPNAVLYQTRIKTGHTLFISESSLVKKFLSIVVTNKLTNEPEYVANLIKQPYFNHWGNCVVTELENVALGIHDYLQIQLAEAAYILKNQLINQGYDSVCYLNEIEWYWQHRWDWIVIKESAIEEFNLLKQVKCFNLEKLIKIAAQGFSNNRHHQLQFEFSTSQDHT